VWGILAEPGSPRRWLAVRRRWGEEAWVWGGNGERGLQEGSATRSADHHSPPMDRKPTPSTTELDGPRPMDQRLRPPKRSGEEVEWWFSKSTCSQHRAQHARIHRHPHSAQQVMRIRSSEGRPGPGDHLSETKTVPRHLHRRLRAPREEKFPPAQSISLDRDVAGERPLVEQQARCQQARPANGRIKVTRIIYTWHKSSCPRQKKAGDWDPAQEQQGPP
jgi:hypothetical protein